MSKPNLPDGRSIETLIDQANAWEKVIDLCHELNIPNTGGTGIDYVLNGIRELHSYKKNYEKLITDFTAILSGEDSRDDFHTSKYMEPAVDE
jgi:hypothetical protein